MKMTFQPKKRQRAKVHGFRARMSSAQVEEKFWPQEEQKEEQDYLLNRTRAAILIVAFCLLNMKKFNSIKKQ